MRGTKNPQATMLSLVTPEQRVPQGHPRGVTPHIAQTRDKRRRSAVDGRTVRHPGYAVSQRIRKEEIFGWAKTVACFRKTRFKGRERTQLAAHFVAAAYNILRISRLLPA